MILPETEHTIYRLLYNEKSLAAGRCSKQLRIIKKSGTYLRNQTLKNLVGAIACLILLSSTSIFLILKLLTARFGLFEEIAVTLLILPLAGFYYFLQKYHIYKSGWEGEKHVTILLKATLNDDYYLINNVHFHNGYGDIDHILLGPNGVFVVETKNWSGRITCSGDIWQRQSTKRNLGSPSEQVKRNAARVKQVIEASGKLPFVWVEAVVVFTNNNADLRINCPSVSVLKLHQLPNYITTHRSSNTLSVIQLETIAKEITKRS